MNDFDDALLGALLLIILSSSKSYWYQYTTGYFVSPVTGTVTVPLVHLLTCWYIFTSILWLMIKSLASFTVGLHKTKRVFRACSVKRPGSNKFQQKNSLVFLFGPAFSTVLGLAGTVTCDKKPLGTSSLLWNSQFREPVVSESAIAPTFFVTIKTFRRDGNCHDESAESETQTTFAILSGNTSCRHRLQRSPHLRIGQSVDYTSVSRCSVSKVECCW